MYHIQKKYCLLKYISETVLFYLSKDVEWVLLPEWFLTAVSVLQVHSVYFYHIYLILINRSRSSRPLLVSLTRTVLFLSIYFDLFILFLLRSCDPSASCFINHLWAKAAPPPSFLLFLNNSWSAIQYFPILSNTITSGNKGLKSGITKTQCILSSTKVSERGAEVNYESCGDGWITHEGRGRTSGAAQICGDYWRVFFLSSGNLCLTLTPPGKKKKRGPLFWGQLLKSTKWRRQSEKSEGLGEAF